MQMTKTILHQKYKKGILDHVGFYVQVSYRDPRDLVISTSMTEKMAAWKERQLLGE